METGLGNDDRIFCLELVPYVPERASPIGLILARCTGAAVETYSRIGIFVFCRSEVGQHEPDAWSAARHSFFAGATMRDVRVV